MQVTVKLFASFRTGRFSSMPQEFSPGTTAGDAVRILGIPEAEVGVLLVNGRHVELDHGLAEGDTLSVFPLVGGG